LTGLPPRDKLFLIKKMLQALKTQGKEAHFMLKTFIQTLQIRTADASGKDLLSRSAPVTR
jgi:hypothetical protein